MVFGLLVRGEVAGAIKSRSTRESYHHRRRYRVLHAIQDGLASVLAELGNHSGKRQTKATIMPKGTAMQRHWSNQEAFVNSIGSRRLPTVFKVLDDGQTGS